MHTVKTRQTETFNGFVIIIEKSFVKAFVKLIGGYTVLHGGL
jgi:hypothetical protein